MKAIRIELLIATLALLASAAASIATVVQTRVVGQEMSASVWPYLTIEDMLSNDDYKLEVINQGLGPAIVQSADLSIDGKPQANWRAALRTIAAKDRHHIFNGRGFPLTQSDFGATSVVRAGESTQIIAVHKPGLGDAVRAGYLPKPDLAVCYCSILQQCWRVDTLQLEQPRAVRDCGTAHAMLQY